MKREIFKLQREVFGADVVLAYNKTQDSVGQFTMSAQAINSTFGTDLKVFYWAERDKKGKLHLIKRAKNQYW